MMCGQIFTKSHMRKQPLAADFHIRKEDYMGANGGVIFPNPNAPTGLLEDISVIKEIVQANPECRSDRG